MFARAYDAPDILARFTETGAGDLRGFQDALEEAAPEWAALRAAVDDGRVLPEMDITDFVLDAMRLIADARAISAREGTAAAKIVQELLNDVDLLDGAVPPLTSALVRKFLPGGRAAPADKIADFMKRYATEAQKVGRSGASLLDDVPGPLDVLKAIDQKSFGQLTETGTTRAGRRVQPDLPEIDLEAMPDNAFADGANSPEVDAADAQLMDDLRGEQPVAQNPTAQKAAISKAELKAFKTELKSSQPVETVGDIYRIAPEAQTFLDDLGERIGKELDVEFRSPGLKARATADEKMRRKAYQSANQMTDVVRGAFIIKTAQQADDIIARLSHAAGGLDQGWSVNKVGYVDRKIMLSTPNGLVAEIQLLMPQMDRAKSELGGHKLYTRSRSETDPKVRADLEEKQRALYSAAISAEDPSLRKAFGTSNEPKVLAKSSDISSSDVSTVPVSATSSASTGTQSPSGSSRANASPRADENSTVGRSSQSINNNDVIGDTSNTDIGAARASVNGQAGGARLRAEGHRWRYVCIQAGCVRQTAWRRWVAALQTIANRVNGGQDKRKCADWHLAYK